MRLIFLYAAAILCEWRKRKNNPHTTGDLFQDNVKADLEQQRTKNTPPFSITDILGKNPSYLMRLREAHQPSWLIVTN